MIKNNYYLQARLFPTVLTSIPMLVFINFVVAPHYNNNLQQIFTYLPAITNTAFSTAVVFLLVQINRVISKEIFQKIYFTDELKMPTTSYMLWQNSQYPDTIKTQIRDKVKNNYNIELLSKDEELREELKARKLIVTACSQMRNSVRDSQLLLQHNIEYGFFRNLIGGSFIAILLCLILIGFSYYFHNLILLQWCIALLCAYTLPIFFSKTIIKKYGTYYAKILIEQFLILK